MTENRGAPSLLHLPMRQPVIATTTGNVTFAPNLVWFLLTLLALMRLLCLRLPEAA
jgi:hypothetical protein